MGILASRVEFSFSRGGLLMWRGWGLDGQRAPSNSWKPFFPVARGFQGAKLAGGDANGAPLTALRRRKSREHESEGEFAPTAWISAFHEFRLWLFDPSILGRAFLCDLVDSQNKLTFGRRVSATAP